VKIIIFEEYSIYKYYFYFLYLEQKLMKILFILYFLNFKKINKIIKNNIILLLILDYMDKICYLKIYIYINYIYIFF
jgi:hypothetical protein